MDGLHTVLIVEDDTDASGIMKDALEVEGYSVVCAADGRQALGVVDSIDHLCLVLLDLFMPGMNGWDFLTAFRARPDGAAVPVFVVTSAPESRPRRGQRRARQAAVPPHLADDGGAPLPAVILAARQRQVRKRESTSVQRLHGVSGGGLESTTARARCG